MTFDIQRCITSQCMTFLCQARNTQDSIRSMYQKQSINNHSTLCVKVIAAQAGFFLITGLAVIETVIYAIIIASAFFKLFNYHDNNYHSYKELFKSSTFTILWGLQNLILNIFVKNVLAFESLARCFTDLYIPCKGLIRSLVREEDKLFLEDIRCRATQLLDVKEIMIFFLEEILCELNDEQKKQIENGDCEIIRAVLMKIIYIHAFCSKKANTCLPYFEECLLRSSNEPEEKVKNKNSEVIDAILLKMNCIDPFTRKEANDSSFPYFFNTHEYFKVMQKINLEEGRLPLRENKAQLSLQQLRLKADILRLREDKGSLPRIGKLINRYNGFHSKKLLYYKNKIINYPEYSPETDGGYTNFFTLLKRCNISLEEINIEIIELKAESQPDFPKEKYREFLAILKTQDISFKDLDVLASATTIRRTSSMYDQHLSIQKNLFDFIQLYLESNREPSINFEIYDQIDDIANMMLGSNYLLIEGMVQLMKTIPPQANKQAISLIATRFRKDLEMKRKELHENVLPPFETIWK